MNKYAEKIERFLLRTINKFVYHGHRAPKNITLMSGEQLNQYIYDGLMADAPFMVARFGSVELDSALYTYLYGLPLLLRYKLYAQKKIEQLRPSSQKAHQLMNALCNNAGFFPNDINYLAEFGEKIRNEDTSCCCCCCCCWNKEDLMLPFFNEDIRFAKLEEMEPYDYSQPWSRALAGKKVLIIHPFADTIQQQYKKRTKLWKNPNVLPEFEIQTIKAVQSIAGEKTQFNDWFEALKFMEDQMDAIDYDIAIIGCGAYGFSLAAHAKRMGKKAIHLGGATQILFGIKGKRWDENPAVNKFYNEYWVYPSAAETPQHKDRVENGCYW
ncbi:MAG: hypothetical protein KBT06_07690 [Prevotellaceae bacterium]|nr:hypothetical protein [Candidatus Colivivens equi]